MNDEIPDGYRLVRKNVDEMVPGDVVSWTAKDIPHFFTVEAILNSKKTWFRESRKYPNGNTLWYSHWVKRTTRIWVLDKISDAG